MRSILVLLFVIVFLILSLPFLLIEWIINKLSPKHSSVIQLRLVQWAFKVILFISGTKLEVIGHENIPKDEAVLYIGNHRGFFDVITTYSLCPGLTGYIAKDSIGKVPILRVYMARLHCLFIDRSDIKQSLKVILAAIDKINSGISICVFPEGTRNKDKEDPTSVLPFKEGSFKIATKTKCKIVPMAITGTSAIFEDHLPWIKKGKVTVQYGEPIDITTLSKEEVKTIGAYTQQKIQNMLKAN